MHNVFPAAGLYLLLALGAVGVWLALPRRGVNPQVLGGILGATAAGLVVLVLTIKALSAGEGLPNVFFYIFSIIALGASLRVITHPRPVYAALYFIMTILASAGLYLILSAEFMAFALVIVYAGAILITYLFVIMLATQAPSAEQTEVLADYDTQAREPIAATAVGFILLAVLTSMLFAGMGRGIEPRGPLTSDAQVAMALPGRLLERLQTAELEGGIEKPRVESIVRDPVTGRPMVSPEGEVLVERAGQAEPEWTPAPPDLTAVSNVEAVGWNLLREYPGSIEIAGVILLMAMLGAVVLARKKVEAEEAEKAAHVHYLSTRERGGAA